MRKLIFVKWTLLIMYVNVLNLLVAGILTEVLLMRTMVDIKVVQ